MNKSYRNVWNGVTSTWCAAAETAKRCTKGTSLIAGMGMLLFATPSFIGLSASWAQTVKGNGALQLCAPDGSGRAWASGDAKAINCISPYSFSINNAGNSTGGEGFSASAARVTGYIDGKLELKGQGGISVLNGIQMNDNTITSLKNATLSPTSTDAVTGQQLYTVQQDVTNNTTAITKLDDRVTTNETSIQSLGDQLANGLVKQDPATGAITIAMATGGNSINLAGTDGNRILTGIANGRNDNDAVTLAQLKATGLIDYTGKELGALVYDDLSLTNVTLGGASGTTLKNVAAGLIAANSMEAINGGQLFTLQQEFEKRFDSLHSHVASLEENGGGTWSGAGDSNPAIGDDAEASGNNSTAIGSNTQATGDNSTAIGQESKASGENSTALGQNAHATGNNSIALGANSIADRDNTLSVGSAGNERQITHVQAGTAPTDAVNVQQMRNTVHSARQDAMGGVAAAMAVAGLPQSSQPGRTFVGLAGGTYAGEYGTALGLSYMSRDGKWTIKASATTNSRGEVGGVIGGGFYW